MGRKVGFLSAVVAVLLACAGSAQAAGSVVLCVPSAAGKEVVSGGSAGSCGSDATKVALPSSAADQQTLLSILPHISFVPGDKPIIRFSGVNVQVVNGTGHTRTVNGLGNLIIGYNGTASGTSQTGSHNLVLGTDQSFTSYGGLIGGENNTASGPFAAVFGNDNNASGDHSAVTGGSDNTASGPDSAVTGGGGNIASGHSSAVTGGTSNRATEYYTAVLGGSTNGAKAVAATVFGCFGVNVTDSDASNPSLCP